MHPFQAVYNSGKATIQARLIILELTRILASHRWRFAMNLNLSGASDSFFFQWCPNLEEAEDAARYCAIILSRSVKKASIILQIHPQHTLSSPLT